MEIVAKMAVADYVRTVNKEWNTLMGYDAIRGLMSVVPQNADNETLDLASSRSAIEGFITDECMKVEILGEPRREIITFFNNLYFSGLDILPDAWWWENRYRFKKLLTVSLALEGINLASFGATPTVMDIPQSLVNIASFIKCLDVSNLEREHKHLCTYTIPEYVDVYTKKAEV